MVASKPFRDSWTEVLGPASLGRVFGLTFLAVYFYVFMEWLFFVTKPSFMSSLPLSESLLILAVSSGPVLVATVAPLVLYWMVGALLGYGSALAGFQVPGPVRALWVPVSLLLPCWVLALAAFLMVDNFTLTVLGWGIRHVEAKGLLGYQALLVLIAVAVYTLTWQAIRTISRHGLGRSLGVACAAMASITLVGTLYLGTHKVSASTPVGPHVKNGVLPNILLIVGDGVEAEHMSLYGYDRDTTPYLRQLADRSLLCENNFPNAGPSAASVASILTGKLPTETRLIYPPDILRGKDAYQHLPAILKTLGYRSANIGLRYYADAYDLNMRHSFDWANDRELKGFLLPEWFTDAIGQGAAYFLTQIRDRIESRLLHVFDVERMSDAFDQLVHVPYQSRGDTERIVQLWRWLAEGEGPFFVYLHMLGTHGPKFRPVRRVYSEGKTQDEPWMTDFYDDAILQFDTHVKKILDGLADRNLLQDTIVVITSDHGIKHANRKRIPLMFLFPTDDRRRRVSSNSQNLDIAPTLLDYLGMDRPGWMTGQSLIGKDPNHERTNFAADRIHGTGVIARRQITPSHIVPPFFSLGSVSLVQCDTAFEFRLRRNVLNVWKVKGHTRPCADGPSPAEAMQQIVGHLDRYDYDTSLLDLSRVRVFFRKE
ncbi:MAG: sulfatase-like hydrolase/transferase [Acidobacteriota bacterium]|nr:sulfatase-like hydrolase/transferase [Acidobacteriota bacterium]